MGSNKDNLEIERKFLMKKFPATELDTVGFKCYEIYQYYYLIDGVRKRYRMRQDTDTFEREYFETMKTVLSPGVFEEIERNITQEEFFEISKANKGYGSVISKNRFVVNQNGLDWEIDRYLNVDLVTLEVELDDINQEIEIPDFLEEIIIMEVTGIEEFSNFNLSLPC